MFDTSKACRAGWLAMLALWVPLAAAQDADAPTRAQRDAANPLRMIIEAGKLNVRQKSRDGEPEAAAKQPAPAPTRAAAARAAAPAAAVAAAAPPARPVIPSEPAGPPLASVAAVPAPATPTVDAGPARAAEPDPAASPVTQEVASAPPQPGRDPSGEMPPPAAPAEAASAPSASAADTARRGAAEASPAASPAARIPEPETEPAPKPAARPEPAAAPASAAPEQRIALAPAAAPAQPAARTALELVDYVEPVLSERLRRRLRADGEVIVEFTVQPDGSVAGLAVRSASDKTLEAAALDAVGQWRYRPIAAAQAHAVQLVFRFRD